MVEALLRQRSSPPAICGARGHEAADRYLVMAGRLDMQREVVAGVLGGQYFYFPDVGGSGSRFRYHRIAPPITEREILELRSHRGATGHDRYTERLAGIRPELDALRLRHRPHDVGPAYRRRRTASWNLSGQPRPRGPGRPRVHVQGSGRSPAKDLPRDVGRP